MTGTRHGPLKMWAAGADAASLTADSDSDANRPTVPHNGSDGRVDWRGVKG